MKTVGRLLLLAALCGGVDAVVAGAPPAASADLVASVWAGCSSCHGDAGEGMLPKGAPRIAGQPATYVAAQLRAFRDGRRGAQPADVAGRQMSLMAAPLADETVVDAVAEFVARLPAGPVPAVLEADIERGAALYVACAACHGAAGEGNAKIASPRLAGIDDGYLLLQLRNYRAGLRGWHPEDAPGRQMAAIARALADERELEDLVAYIASIR